MDELDWSRIMTPVPHMSARVAQSAAVKERWAVVLKAIIRLRNEHASTEGEILGQQSATSMAGRLLKLLFFLPTIILGPEVWAKYHRPGTRPDRPSSEEIRFRLNHIPQRILAFCFKGIEPLQHLETPPPKMPSDQLEHVSHNRSSSEQRQTPPSSPARISPDVSEVSPIGSSQHSRLNTQLDMSPEERQQQDSNHGTPKDTARQDHLSEEEGNESGYESPMSSADSAIKQACNLINIGELGRAATALLSPPGGLLKIVQGSELMEKVRALLPDEPTLEPDNGNSDPPASRPDSEGIYQDRRLALQHQCEAEWSQLEQIQHADVSALQERHVQINHQTQQQHPTAEQLQQHRDLLQEEVQLQLL